MKVGRDACVLVYEGGREGLHIIIEEDKFLEHAGAKAILSL